MLTQEKLKEFLNYDPVTGIFKWKKYRPGINKNRIAGYFIVGNYDGKSSAKGCYRKIAIDGKRYLEHRLAWFYVYGVWPSNLIDHIDGKRDNNAINNLRDVTYSVNRQNMRIAQKSNSTGLLGVTLNKKTKKYEAAIFVNDKTIHIGRFNTPEEAHQAYLEKKRILHAGCTI